jgi:hypothetical protein
VRALDFRFPHVLVGKPGIHLSRTCAKATTLGNGDAEPGPGQQAGLLANL